MQWQRKLGEIRPALKLMANKWPYLTDINFVMILISNILIIMNLEWCSDTNKSCVKNADTKLIVDTVSFSQTIIAFIVCISYYIENREIFNGLIEIADRTKSSGLQDFGENPGSQGRGSQKSEKFNITLPSTKVSYIDKKISQFTGSFGKVFVLIAKEVKLILRSIIIDASSEQTTGRHFKNVAYTICSVASIFDYTFTSFLLLDIMSRVEVLKEVVKVFAQNQKTLGYVMILMISLIFISAFLSFYYFRTDFQNNDFNMYCENLTQCFLTTFNVGLRTGGGIGEALAQPKYHDTFNGLQIHYQMRWIFDFLYFFFITIIIMNMFFGIIIDSFGAKRDMNTAKQKEIFG